MAIERGMRCHYCSQDIYPVAGQIVVCHCGRTRLNQFGELMEKVIQPPTPVARESDSSGSFVRADHLWFDQALRDVTMITKETPWDVARRIGELLAHVVRNDVAEGVDHLGFRPDVCNSCARAEVYARVLEGGLQLGPDTQEG